MTDLSSIKRDLENLGFQVKGEVVGDPDNPKKLFATVLISRDADGKQQPTKMRLNEARSYFEGREISLHFILYNSETSDLETGLRATLMLVFPSLRNVFCSINDGRASVWIEPKTQLEEPLLKEIETHTKNFFQLVGIHLEVIQSTSDERTPTKTAMLDSVRIIAPADRAALMERLRARDFVVPSEDWLKRRLDSLRKSGAIVVGTDGKISLSLRTLRSLGTKKNARSPDVTRLLALARQGS